MSNTQWPSREGNVSPWVQNFVQVALANLDQLTTLTQTQVEQIEGSRTQAQGALGAKVAAYEAAKSSTANKDAKFGAMFALLSPAVNSILADANVDESLKIELGLTPRQPSTHVSAAPPDSVTADGFSNGVNTIKWRRTGAGNARGVIFQIEALYPNSTAWTLAGSTTKTTFNHTGQTPGVTVSYRIRTQKAGEVSQPSNTANVYPAPGQTVSLQLAA